MPLPPSAADWIRLKRLRNTTGYSNTIAANKDVLNKVTRGNPFNPDTYQSRAVGSSKTRREASKWTDFVASQHENYIQKSANYSYTEHRVFTGTKHTITRLCTCVTTTLGNKSTKCAKCM
jgi:hypothetical protein